ncbi:MAG TPA: ribonuclease HI [Thermoanaerobaculia bacterium]|jgi:ribonuclease HI|nr:ribonuclease HI [Thermoanaerobaculia bacterium]
MTPAIPEPLSEVTVYTDGGADPNPGPGGWGVILLHTASGKATELKGGEPRTTNNRMELTAAIRALEALKRRCRVRLYTDSQYLRKGITEWLPGWVQRGWKRKDGELQNEDLWRRLAELILEHDIRWDWVKGHAGNRWNERADQLATQAIREQQKAAGVSKSEKPAERPDAEVFLRVSASGKGSGWAALIRHEGSETVISGGGKRLSSNQLDLIAAAEALDRLPPGISVAVYTLSDYLRNGATGWIQGWRRRNWMTQEGKPVLHRDLWERLDAALTRRRVTWPVVKKDAKLPELEALKEASKPLPNEP